MSGLRPPSEPRGWGAAPPSLPLGRLIELRDETETVFLATGPQLVEIAGLLESARLAARSLDDLARIDVIDRFRTEADVQSAAFRMLAADFTDSGKTLGAATTGLNTLDSGINDVRRAIVTMQIVVLNARVNLASLSAEDQKLSSFAEGGLAVVAESTSLLARLDAAMAVIRKAAGEIEAMVDQISAALTDTVLAAFKALMVDVAGFERAIGTIRTRGADLARKLQAMLDATSTAVAALQVGDSTRQQLDHIIAILSLPDAQDPALQALASALLRDCARTHAQMLTRLRTGLGKMTTGLTDLVRNHMSRFFEINGKDVDAETLVADSDRLARSIAELQPLQARTRHLSKTMAAEFETFRGLILEGEGVQESARMIGINAVLSCRRLQEGSAALKVVAEQLQVVSQEVGERFSVIRAILDRIGSLGNDIATRTDRLIDQSVALPERLSANIGPMIDTVTDHLTPAQHAIEQLQERAWNLSFDLGPALRHNSDLGALAAQGHSVTGPVRSDGISDVTLARICAAFTMEREREVFRTVLPDRVNCAPPPATAPRGQTTDDFLL